MPPKRRPSSTSRPVTPFDSETVLSQESRISSNDDIDFEMYAMAVAELKVSLQKHKQEKEKKLLQATQKELDDHLNSKQAEIGRILLDIEGLYQDFLTKYVIIEDKQRAVMSAIIEKQNTLVALCVQRHRGAIELGQEVEDGQLEGMSQVKEACKDFSNVGEMLLEL
ncbi:hypothetical protein F5I97DRAFT_423953 [Phlebopus sp. FC_14]|nr:hypothetical protein F5I97DRAFT_423953 [Phlebopus sp. FC_14]